MGIFDPNTESAESLRRIADALERLVPPPPPILNLAVASAYVWRIEPDRLDPVPNVSRVDLDLLVGVDRARDTLLENTRRFAKGLPANNALLWGARGMGKSSLVKAVHAQVNAEQHDTLLLIEVLREDMPTLDRLLAILRAHPERRALIFCDDLSFEKDDAHYKALKAALDGGVEGRPENVLLYATSNRRHLMPRDMIENERQSGINPSEAVEEKVSLSDRFGLWLGFHACSQAQFLEMVAGYVAAYDLQIEPEALEEAAIEWRQTRGAVSGRVAWQFVQDLAGQLGQRLERDQK
ncbi:MAG: ATP-binding protein [Neomegalonema sp.]|nr:ATP-binding protein [Neomegalonema sp.]